MKILTRKTVLTVSLYVVLAGLVSGCVDLEGSNRGDDQGWSEGFMISGTISNLNGSGLQLSVLGGGGVSVESGETEFRVRQLYEEGFNYTVIVSSQPANPSQHCEVINASGQIQADVDDVAVVCTDMGFSDFRARPLDRSMELRWRLVGVDVDNVSLCRAREAISDRFSDCEMFEGGTTISNVESGHRVGGLDNWEDYWFRLEAVDGQGGTFYSDVVKAVPRGVGLISHNDSGVDWCADGQNFELACPVSAFPEQDAEFGRDAAARAGALNKQGSGAAGFDFSKLSASGTLLAASAEDAACAIDNHTGLVWELKNEDPNSPHFYDYFFSWYDSRYETIANRSPGQMDRGLCIDGRCDTEGFVETVNRRGLCGFRDWRMPTVDELSSIVHHGVPGLTIDEAFFPHAQDSIYWSGSLSASGPSDVWLVEFGTGRAVPVDSHQNAFVRLVREP